MKRLRSKLTYANVMSTIAVFLVLGSGAAVAATQMLPKNSVGPKQLKKGAVTGAKIMNGAVTGAKLDLSSLGTVPAAVHAATAGAATTAGGATNADHATNADKATNADHATSADNAEKLNGTAAAGYAKTTPEAVHVIGASGQPAFESGCAVPEGEFIAPGFYKDAFGEVHLRGFARCPFSNPTVFTLPPGSRPTAFTFFIVATGNTPPAETLEIAPSGKVELAGTKEASLEGVSFRTD